MENAKQALLDLAHQIQVLERQRADDRIMHIALRQRVEALEGAAEDRSIEREDGEYQRRQIRELYAWLGKYGRLTPTYEQYQREKMRELWPWLASEEE